MQRMDRVATVVLIVAGLLLAACGQAEAPNVDEPARLELVAGSDLGRIILTEKAVERLGIETAPVREELVERTRIVTGQIERVETAMPVDSAAPENSDVSGDDSGVKISPAVFEETGFSTTLVRVPLTPGDAADVDKSRTVVVVPLDDLDGTDGLTAEIDEGSDDDDDPAGGEVAGDDDDGVLYYSLTEDDHGLKLGQRVRVEIAMTGSGKQQAVMPYTAIFYGMHGDTWTYISPEAFTYERYPIVIDFIDGERAILSDGPPTGTEVVTVGALELYGTELGIGK